MDTAAATITTVAAAVDMAATETMVEAAAATTTLDTATTEVTVSGPFSFGHAPSHLYTPDGHDSSFCFTISLATDEDWKKKYCKSRVRFLAEPQAQAKHSSQAFF